jgi:2-methylisocitrate lyase-like PEP mutase family enzyme
MALNRQTVLAQTFLDLHTAASGFIMPNAWDAGSAVILASEGFPAIGTTSAGVAFSLGKPDYKVDDPRLAVSRAEMLAAVERLTSAVDIPVNADLEAGYGDAPEAVAETVRLALDSGAAGGNIEDMCAAKGALFPEDLAVERIAAAREAIKAAGTSFVLNARTDVFLLSETGGMNTAIRRANRYLEAGADCVFVPGITDLPTVRTLAREIAGPLNIVIGLNEAASSGFDLLEAGVKRISVGGSIARSALGLVQRAARELKTSGTVSYAREQIRQAELNALFARAHSSA